jgi:hypothetical protein
MNNDQMNFKEVLSILLLVVILSISGCGRMQMVWRKWFMNDYCKKIGDKLKLQLGWVWYLLKKPKNFTLFIIWEMAMLALFYYQLDAIIVILESYWCAIVLGGLLVIHTYIFRCINEEPKSDKEANEDTYADQLQRTYIAKQLVDIIYDHQNDIRRVGMMGDWGEGKTFLMKMVERELIKRSPDENKFRMAWINPWHQKGESEAWVEIAKGIERALGFPRVLPEVIFSVPVLKWFLMALPKLTNGLMPDLKVFLNDSENEAARIAKGLDDYLKEKNTYLVIFVDDMDRVNAEQLKKILPVIDRLPVLKRCYFIFSIAPDRMAKAFNEACASEKETKGYLDKLLDLKIDMPDVDQSLIFELCKKRISKDKYARLYHSLDELKNFLPTNPRELMQFIRHAKGREKMFLSRYGEHEQNFLGYFLLLILEISHASDFEKLKDKYNKFKKGPNSDLFIIGKGIKEYLDESQWSDQKIIGKIKEQFIDPVDAVFSSKVCLDLQWAFEDCLKLDRLSDKHHHLFVKEFEKYAKGDELKKGLPKSYDMNSWVEGYDYPVDCYENALVRYLWEILGGGHELNRNSFSSLTKDITEQAEIAEKLKWLHGAITPSEDEQIKEHFSKMLVDGSMLYEFVRWCRNYVFAAADLSKDLEDQIKAIAEYLVDATTEKGGIQDAQAVCKDRFDSVTLQQLVIKDYIENLLKNRITFLDAKSSVQDQGDPT